MFELKNVHKRFPGVHALNDISIRIEPGEIIGLVGENGAGKSTLMKVIYGAYQHDEGELIVHGKAVRFSSPRDAMDRGIGMVFQEQSLILNLSVMENIFLGNERHFSAGGVMRWKQMAEAARVQLRKVNLDIDPTMPTSRLSFAQRQMVELAKVLTMEERIDGQLIILLDEPTSVLSGEEIETLFSLVRKLRTRASFIFVSHRLDEICTLTDRIYVMRDGQVVGTTTSAEADVEDIQHRMVGRQIDHEYYRERKQLPFDADKPLLTLENLTLENHYSDISLTLHAGEVMALVGTEGSGTENIIRTIFGLEKADSGRITIGKESRLQFRPDETVARGVGYVPRERKFEGIVGNMSVAENISLPFLKGFSRHGILRKAFERKVASDWIGRLSIKTPSPDANCRNLSGGNQQKVVIAKWKHAGSNVVLLDHPTRGLDIGAKEDVYDLLRDMSAQGVGVILLADTLEEAIGLSHTIHVVKDGTVRQSFQGMPGSKPQLYDLLHHMI